MSWARRRSRGWRCTARSGWTRCFARRPRRAAGGRGTARRGRRTTAAEAADAAGRARTTWSRGELTLDLGGGREVLLANVGPGHTGHDLAVLVPGHGRRRRSSSAATWSRSRANPRRAPTPSPSQLARGPGPAAGAGRRGRAVRARARSGGGRGVRAGAAGRAGGAVRRVVTVTPARFSYRHAACASTRPDLTPPWKKPKPAPEVPADPDLVVEEVTHRLLRRGDPLREDGGGPTVTLEDRFGKHRVFPHGAARLPAGGPGRSPWSAPCAGGRPHGPARTASGSVAVPGARARVARAGPHLRRGPARRGAGRAGLGRRPAHRGRGRRVPGGRRRPPGDRRATSPPARTPGSASWSTTWCPARRSPGSRQRSPASTCWSSGHPYIDIWEAVKPSSVGIPAWPRVPRGQDWKTGVCRALGWPENTGRGLAARSCARSARYKDLEPALLGRVEELIDFVTARGLSRAVDGRPVRRGASPRARQSHARRALRRAASVHQVPHHRVGQQPPRAA